MPSAETTPEPSTESPPEPSPEPTAEPTSEEAGPPPLTWEPPPAKPAELEDHGQIGAEAFTHYAVEVINYAQKFNDPDPLREISSPSCLFCDGLAGDIGTLSELDVRRVGGLVELRVDELAYQEQSDLYYVNGEWTFGAYIDYDAEDQIVAQEAGADRYGSLVIGTEESEWLIFEIGTSSNE